MPLTDEMLQYLRDASHARAEATATLAIRICEVPSPTGDEAERAAFIAALLRERGYVPEIDAISNVYVRRGNRGGKIVMVTAHTDTVFPRDTPISVRRVGTILTAPGIGDNSISDAGLLTLLDILDERKIETDSDLLLTWNVGEEGLGDLRGIREAVARHREALGAVLVVDTRFGELVSGAVGSARWRVTVRGPGGHSYLKFGQPSAIHGLGRIIAGIAALDVPHEPKTTYNVGTIGGGTSVNTIAAEAHAVIDMRSEDPAALNRLTAQVRDIIETAPGDGLTVVIDVVGERPAGRLAESDPIVQCAANALRWYGIEPSFDTSSTDANIPISLGISSVCLGFCTTERGHSTDEYCDIATLGPSIAVLARTVLDAGSIVAGGEG
jgi:tripeptide aminopeptidase